MNDRPPAAGEALANLTGRHSGIDGLRPRQDAFLPGHDIRHPLFFGPHRRRMTDPTGIGLGLSTNRTP
jgi:hypothetical protein